MQKTLKLVRLYVVVGVQLSLTAPGNVMSHLCSEEGNRDSWLELQTHALLQANRETDSWTGTSDIIRKWEHQMFLYGLHSVITPLTY